MNYNSEFLWIPKYEFTSSNQHGSRFKRTGEAQVKVAKLSAKVTNAGDLQDLILLSHTLNAPIRYDFDASPQEAFIEIVSKEKLSEVI